MGVFSKGQKGMHCNTEADGSVVCERTKVDPKTGQMMTDGQRVRIVADPSNNCTPRFEGETNVLDDEWGKFEEIGKKVSQGCRRSKSSPQ